LSPAPENLGSFHFDVKSLSSMVGGTSVLHIHDLLLFLRHGFFFVQLVFDLP